MKCCNGIAIAMVSFCGLSALSTASALDLRKATKDLYYECHTEMSAGLYKDPKSGEIQATVFEPDPSDRWEMKLVRIRSQDDFKKLPHACGYQRSKQDHLFPNSFDEDFPEFCKVKTIKDEGRTLVRAEFCELTSSGLRQGYNAIACGLEDTTFFDSDRLFGIDGSNPIAGFGDLSAKFVVP
jgi:hypothetical protein